MGQLALVVLVTLDRGPWPARSRPHPGHRDLWFYLNVLTLVLGLLGALHATLVLLRRSPPPPGRVKIPPKTGG